MGTWGGLARRSFSSAGAGALGWLSGCAAGVVEGSMAVVIESNITKLQHGSTTYRSRVALKVVALKVVVLDLQMRVATLR